MSHAPFTQSFPHGVYMTKYSMGGQENWSQTSQRVVNSVMGALYFTDGMRRGDMPVAEIGDASGRIYDRHNRREFIAGGRYLYAAGRDFHQVQNCLLLRCDDSREGWANIAWQSEMALLTGAGIGIYWGDVRGNKSPVRRTGGVASGPIPKAISTNEQGRAAVQGGNRRCAIWGGLLWSHPDVFDWITSKHWPEYLKAQKAIDPATPAPLDSTNISVCLDDDFFAAFHNPAFSQMVQGPRDELQSAAPDGGSWHDWAQRVYWATVDSMTVTGEPGFSVDTGANRDEKLRNACTEITSADDSDVCNLGGLVLPRFDTPKEFGRAVRDATLFLTAGTLYSDLPYEKVAEVRDKNRRLGLDILGVHEFLLRHGAQYGTDHAEEVLEPYMREYARALEYANDWQDRLGISRSVAATSGAPTGTRGIIAETTTGWEPVYASAYKRTIRDSHGRGETRSVQYVVDPSIKRLVEEGVLAEDAEVEDAVTLAYNYERRFNMQKFAQKWTDQAISMTINLPHPMRDPLERRAFGDSLIQYLPDLRGITVYPDGAISGQPIEACALSEALGKEGVIFEEDEARCVTGACGV